MDSQIHRPLITGTRPRSVLRSLLFRFTLSCAVLSAMGGTQPVLTVSGGISLNGTTLPLTFTWQSPISVRGSGWAAGESVRLELRGPLDSPGVAARPARGIAAAVARLAAGAGRRPARNDSPGEPVGLG